MIRFECDCVGCDWPCMGKKYCPLTNVPHLYCDKCGDEAEELYWLDDGTQACKHCIREVYGDLAEENFEKVEVDDGQDELGADDWDED